MTTSHDLILLPLFRQNGQDLPELPGLYAAQAQGRVARGRSLETLVIHLGLKGTAPLSPKGYDKLVRHLTEMYFQTPGSSISAMRTVADWLNNYLVERNARGANRAMKSTGSLTLGVFRGKGLYLAQCGLVHAYLVTSGGLTHLHDPDLAGRGLGLGRVLDIRFHQVEISSGDIMLISADPPPVWTTGLLNGLRGLTTERLHRRLLELTGAELQAALVQVEEGSGQLTILRPELSRRRQSSPEQEKSEVAVPGIHPGLVGKRPEVLASAAGPTHHPAAPPHEAQRPEQISHAASQRLVSSEVHDTKTTSHAGESQEYPSVQPRERIVGPALYKGGQAAAGVLRQVLQGLGVLLKRILPDDSILTIPPNILAFMAVAIPVIVVAVAATVYFQRGRGRMYEEHYLQARYAADIAIQLTEPAALREGWQAVLFHLDNAEAYQVTEESQDMREYAQIVLDNLDYVVRLPFRSALLDNLPKDTLISRIVVTDDDGVLYMLNEVDGGVFRAVRSDQGYTLDPEFICGPVNQPALIVGPLVDILPLPLENDENADILGMDANGNLLYCIPGNQPPLSIQMPPPDMNWGTPKAFVRDSVGLYVLDPITNAVWAFWHSDGFTSLPTLFFDEDIPPMGDVIDLTINRDDLFLLHKDGHFTRCTYGTPTWCEDPALINDSREGMQGGETIDDAVFSEIQFAPPPDPSLYLLEPETPSIYHFSVRLTYQRQYRALNPLPDGPATAFTVSRNHQVFLAMGDRIYYAPLP